MQNVWSCTEVDKHSDFAKFKKLKSTLTRIESQLNFLKKCLEVGIMPKSIAVKTTRQGQQVDDIVDQCNRRLLKLAIKCKYKDLENCSKELLKQHLYLGSIYPTCLLIREFTIIDGSIQNLRNQLKKQKEKKINFLGKMKKNRLPLEVPYQNYSGKQIPNDIDRLLKRGPKYAYNNDVDTKELVLASENLLDTVPSEHRDITRIRIASVIDKHLKKNSKRIKQDKKEMNKLRYWAKRSGIKVLRADKSKDIVILDEGTYNDKVNEYIAKTNCKLVKTNPTNKACNEVKAALSDENLPEEIRKFGHPPSHPRVPLLFNQLKTHKPDLPLRPMVARWSAPTYNLEKAITKYISPYIYDKEYLIHSTDDFVEKTKNNIPRNFHLASLDVEALYPSTPIEVAINLITKRLREKGIHINVIAAIMKALMVCCRFNYFMHNNKIYQQTKGTPIGASISGLLADIVLQDIERKILSRNLYKEVIFHRYVDDCFIASLNRNIILELAKDMSAVYDSINFTFEEESNNKLNFLDVEIYRSENGYNYRVFRKKTTKPIYIPNTSNHPWSYKMSAFSWLVKRALNVPTTQMDKLAEIEKVKAIANGHGYNFEDIGKWINKDPTNPNNSVKRRPFPFTSNLSRRISKIVKEFDISLAHTNRRSIFNIVKNDRDNTDPNQKPGVYRIPITNIDTNTQVCYIGKTKNTIKERVTQHINDVKKGEMKNSIARYVNENNAIPSWKDVKTLRVKYKNRDLIRLESYEIQTARNCINAIDGANLNTIWKTIVRKYE